MTSPSLLVSRVVVTYCLRVLERRVGIAAVLGCTMQVSSLMSGNRDGLCKRCGRKAFLLAISHEGPRRLPQPYPRDTAQHNATLKTLTLPSTCRPKHSCIDHAASLHLPLSLMAALVA